MNNTRILTQGMGKALGLLAILLLVSTGVWADPPIGPDPGGPIGDGIPIDGGASLLLAAGAGYGLQKLKAKKARTSSSSEDTPTTDTTTD